MNFVKSLLPVVAAVSLASCTNTTASNNDVTKKETAVPEEEKIFVIHPIKDTTSVHNHLRALVPYSTTFPKSLADDTLRRQLAGDIITTYTSDTMKLHVKGDVCWIEYISAGMSSAKKKDGSSITGLAVANEKTDMVRIK